MTIALAQHTLGHLDCPACNASLHKAMDADHLSHLSFSEASPLWLESRKPYISARTHHCYQQYLDALSPFFSAMQLESIHIGNIREFQKWRKEKASNLRINHELGALQQMLRRAGLWAKIEQHYETLPIPKPKIDTVLTPEEEHRFFQAARKNKRWKVAYWASSLSANTTAGPGEIRYLRIGDVDLERKLLYVREGTKLDFPRIRKIPLNDRAFTMACRLLERARDLGATSLEDFLLPHRANKRGQGFDFTRPMYSWYTAWRAICKEAEVVITPYRLRHLSITKLLENPDVSEETVKSIAGHVSPRILQTYSHVRLKAKEDALKALEQPSGRMQPVRMVPDWYFTKGKAVEKKAGT